MPQSSPLWYAMPPYSSDDKNGDGNPFDFPPFSSIALEQFPEGDAADAAARTMLVNAGWAYDCATGNLQTGTEFPLCKAGKTEPLSFRFSTFNTEPWWETAARGVIADAAKAGIQFNLELLNGAQMYSLWYRLDYDVWLWDWVWTPITDTSLFLIVQTCHGIVTFDNLYNQTLTTTDPVARRALSDQAQQIIYSYASYNLPFYRDELYAYNQLHFTNFVDFSVQRAVPPDIGNTPVFGQTVYPVDDKPPQFTLPTFEGVVGKPVQFSAAAVDPQGGALRYRGVPYLWAGTTPSGFDCSGFTRFVYAHFHIALPHSPYGQWAAGPQVSRSRLLPGDLVFFGMGHVGLWLGHGRFIHAPHTGDVVSVTGITTSWYAGTYSGAVRPPGSQRRYPPRLRSSNPRGDRHTAGRVWPRHR